MFDAFRDEDLDPEDRELDLALRSQPGGNSEMHQDLWLRPNSVRKGGSHQNDDDIPTCWADG